MILGGYWSSYWYDGRIYATEITRGLDVFALTPSDYLSAAEIAAAEMADHAERFNPQQQFEVTWPADPVVARVYLEQLQESDAIPAALAADVSSALDDAAAKRNEGARDRGLARRLNALAKTVRNSEGMPATQKWRAGLAEALDGLSKSLS